MTEWRYAPGPAFERGDREQREHSLGHVVEVEVAILPLSLHFYRITDVASLIHDVLATAQFTTVQPVATCILITVLISLTLVLAYSL